MENIRLIDIKKEILSDNRGLADKLRERLARRRVFLLNLMGSPGAGKTSLITETIEALHGRLQMAVIEADIDSMVDAQCVASLGVQAVQLRTGGFCHVDASMTERALEQLPLEKLDLVILENVGNLVCPAESDTGAVKNTAILSVPEGDDKPLKYPLIFSVIDSLVISKMDSIELFEFDLDKVQSRVRALNRNAEIFPLSCRTSQGLEQWTAWLEREVREFQAELSSSKSW